MTTHTDPAPITPAMLQELARHLEALSDACRLYEASNASGDADYRVDDIEWLVTCAQDVTREYRAAKGLPS